MEDNNLNLLQLLPNTRINEKWFIYDNHLRNIVDSYHADLKFKNFTEDKISGPDYYNLILQHGFLHVVAETVYNYPTTFISEKTIKPILHKRPFVIIGPTGSLEQLHSLGFKTFSKFWDESYDSIDSNEKRILAVVDIVECISKLSIADVQSLCVEMADVLNYNYEYFVNKFKRAQLSKFNEDCIKNLQPR